MAGVGGADLNREREKTIAALEEQAKGLYEAGKDDEAADVYERAGRLLERHAAAAASRRIERARKGKALKYLEYAAALRSGDIPKPEASATGEVTSTRGAPTRDAEGRAPVGQAGRKGDKAEDEIRSAVTGLLHHSNIGWDQIGGLEETKREIKYALGVALAQRPEGLKLASWRNVLFFGPPGTGKTLLAAATSRAMGWGGQRQASFFNVKVSSVMSKYFGESTKIISELYGTARDVSPSVVFLDEFESLCGSRNEGDTGTERRILSTILSELDGLAEKDRGDVLVLTIAATNRPWDLDPAVLSRFDKKVLIPLPDPVTRRAILDIQLGKRGFKVEVPPEQLVELTEGLSGREIESLCKEVTNRMISHENADIPQLVDRGLEALKDYRIKVRALRQEDFERARRLVSPVTSSAEMQRYVAWREAAEA